MSNEPRDPAAALCLSELQHPADGAGIRCRACGCPEFSVVYTRKVAGGIRRRRQCRNCGQRITTTERSQ